MSTATPEIATKIAGRAWVYGDNIDTDVIIPARYLLTTDLVELAKHCMEDIDATFVPNVQTGDIVLGGNNFGCGSSREHAPMAFKGAGISIVIATSFARIFFRNAINIGLLIMECPDIAEQTSKGDTIQVDLASGVVTNATTGKTYQAQTYPESILTIVSAGGLIAATRAKLQRAGKVPAE